MRKKLVSVLCIMALAVSIVGCGGAKDTDKNTDKDAGSKTEEQGGDSVDKEESNVPGADLVGRWEQCYATTDDGEDGFAIDRDMKVYYVEFYSDGTGKTNFYISHDDDIVFEWAIEDDEWASDENAPKIIGIYSAHEPSDDEPKDANGYRVLGSAFGGAYVLQDKKAENGDPVKLCNVLGGADRFIKVDAPDFKDERPAGYDKAFESIDSYRADEDAYDSQFETEEDEW